MVPVGCKYDHHFEKDGIPLSALEIREEYLKNGAADIIMVNGPERFRLNSIHFTRPVSSAFAQTYTWIEWDQYNDLFTAYPKHTYKLMMYQDDYFKNHTWYWGGNHTGLMISPDVLVLEPSRDAFEWTPGVIESKVEIKGNLADVHLNSETPNLKEYQMKESFPMVNGPK